MTRLPLSPDEIFRAALDLVDAEGLDAVTMRRLAADLGVATMSLYGHVRTKGHVLLGVLNAATAEMALPDPDTPPWEALRMIVREFRRVSQLHPNLVPLIAIRPPTGAAGLRTLEASLDALRRAGIDPEGTACAYRRMASFAIGFVVLETGGFFRPVSGEPGGAAADPDLAARPRVLEIAPHLAQWDSDAEFEAGMDAVIDVLARDAAQPRGRAT